VIDVTVLWSSVCHVHVMHGAQTAEDIDTISFAQYSPMSLPVMLKFGLHRSTPCPQILPQSDPPLLSRMSESFDGKLRSNG